jgi:hypothetical protein
MVGEISMDEDVLGDLQRDNQMRSKQVYGCLTGDEW